MGIEDFGKKKVVNKNETKTTPPPTVQRLEDALPFLKYSESEDEKDFNAQMRKAADLMSAGKMDEAIALSKSLRGKGPKEKGEIEFTPEQEKQFETMRTEIAEGLGYTDVSSSGKWFSAQKDGYKIQMKHFMLPSTFGVEGGRISEIEISKGKKSALWDNGWDEEPTDAGIIKIFRELVEHLN